MTPPGDSLPPVDAGREESSPQLTRIPIGKWRSPGPAVGAPSWVAGTSASWAKWLLIFICCVTIGFVIIWLWTLPKLPPVTGADAERVSRVVEAFQTARRAHFNDIRDMFLLVITTVLAPTLALLFGHAFGVVQEQSTDLDGSDVSGD